MSIQEEKLQAIADAIREKDGTTELIPANDFPERIRAISSVPDGLRTITLAADPPEGGTVSGGGVASDGMTVTVKAEAAEGYNSAGWQENGEDVSEEPEYTFPVQGDRELAAVFAAKPASRLPEGYTEVEYIESDGSSCIDTKIQPSEDIVFTIDVEPKQEIPNVSTSYTIFWSGTYRPLQNNGYYFGCRFRYYGVAVTKAPGAWTNASQSYVYINDNKTPRRMTIGMNLPDGKAYIVGESEITISSGTYPRNAYTIILLAGTATSTDGIIAKLYSCQIEQGGQTVRDFVPCISPDGTVGMYDLSGNEFYANTSSGTFTAGPAV